MKKIKVMFFSNQWSMGGGEHTFQLSIKYMNREKFDIIAGGWKGGPRLEKIKNMGIETFVEQDQQKMINWMKSKKLDIVYVLRMGVTESILIDTFVAAGIPIIIEHNCFGLFDASADRIKINRHVVPSMVTVKIYAGRAGIFYEPKKVSQVYPAVETEIFKNYKFERDWSAPIFGKHARKDATKWHPIQFQILPLVKSAVPDAKFYTMGLPDEYRPMLKELNIEDMIVEFPSNTDDNEVLNFLNKITVFTHANIYGESFGNSLSEAMASGLPILTHTGGDSAQCELVTDNFNGLISNLQLHGSQIVPATPAEVQDYANRLIHLLKNPALKQSFGEAGKKRCFDWFSGDIVTKKLEDVFIEEYNSLHKTNLELSTYEKPIPSGWRESWTPQDYINHVQKSIDDGLARKSRADNFPLQIHGMSTPEFRSYLNNLCSPEGANYLEIGPWIGGTICSAISNNKTLTSFVIDNFEYDPNKTKNIKDNLVYNINQVESTTKDITLLDGDCFSMNQDLITKKIDFYLYDALHTRENQRKAITDFLNKMNDTFVWIVGDYNEPDVQDGTADGLAEVKDMITIHKEWVFLTPIGWSPLWQNGCYMAVISKKK